MRLQVFRNSAAVASFFKRWKLSVYFSLRFQVGCSRDTACLCQLQHQDQGWLSLTVRAPGLWAVDLTLPVSVSCQTRTRAGSASQSALSVSSRQQQGGSTWSQLQRDCTLTCRTSP